MAGRKIKVSLSEKERMTEANLDTVIAMLEPKDSAQKPWTKKECCTFLGMSYNTSRLATIIQNRKEAKQYEADRRAANKGKTATATEIQYVLQSYVNGDTIESIAKSLFRSSGLVKRILTNNNVTIRPVSHDYFKPVLIPDDAVRESFKIGEVVYSAKYNVNAEVRAEFQHATEGKVYRIWLLGDRQEFAYTPAYELASLEHLRELGIAI